MNDSQDKTLQALPGRVAGLRQSLQGAEPQTLAETTGARFEETGPNQGRFHLELWGQPVVVDFPAFVAKNRQTGTELSIDQQALLLFYFQTSVGTLPAGRWISFSELPEGKFYNAAYQGYTGSQLARHFKEDRQAFERASQAIGGNPVQLGQAAFAFQILPKVFLLAVYWEGDEDFPASMQVLFDAAAVQHLPTDVCAIAGGMLARRILKAAANMRFS